MPWTLFLVFAILALACAWGGTGAILRVLERRAILDHPNERSSHAVPTPRGGGLAVIAVILAAWTAIAWGAGTLGLYWPALAGALALAAVSWFDDLRGLGPVPRLAVQAAAVAAGIFALPGPGPVFQGLLPPALDAFAAAFLWLWFVNLFNFMDGIDGISGAETACIGGGVCVLALVEGWTGEVGLYALTAAAAALGFLAWNWQPARIFLGDVGSVTLGYLLGWLLLGLAATGYWAAALLLPLYYLADATLTLLSRLRRREPIWQAHRKHYYQRAIRRGLNHVQVVRVIMALNALLVGLAILSLSGDGGLIAALAIGALSVIGVLWYFRGSSGDY